MALEWLEPILRDAYNEEVDRAVSAEIGRAFVAKPDFDAQSNALQAAEAKLAEANKTIEALRAEGQSLAAARKEAADYKARAEQAEADAAAKAEAYQFDRWFDALAAQHKARNADVLRTLAGEERMQALRESENREADGKALFEALEQDAAYAFDAAPLPLPYAANTGSMPMLGAEAADGVSAAFSALNPHLKL